MDLGKGDLNKNVPKIQMPEGMLKLRFDWYITVRSKGYSCQLAFDNSVLITYNIYSIRSRHT